MTVLIQTFVKSNTSKRLGEKWVRKKRTGPASLQGFDSRRIGSNLVENIDFLEIRKFFFAIFEVSVLIPAKYGRLPIIHVYSITFLFSVNRSLASHQWCRIGIYLHDGDREDRSQEGILLFLPSVSPSPFSKTDFPFTQNLGVAFFRLQNLGLCCKRGNLLEM